MMELILIRHAKSSWDFQVKDFERPLSQRGINDMALVYSKLNELDLTGYEIFSSSALRAKETATGFIDFFQNYSFKVQFEDKLYTFDDRVIFNFITTCASNKIIIFGHNPALTEFVNKFSDYYLENIPTSGIVCLTFEEQKISINSKGKITNIIFPKKLR